MDFESRNPCRSMTSVLENYRDWQANAMPDKSFLGTLAHLDLLDRVPKDSADKARCLAVTLDSSKLKQNTQEQI